MAAFRRADDDDNNREEGGRADAAFTQRHCAGCCTIRGRRRRLVNHPLHLPGPRPGRAQRARVQAWAARMLQIMGIPARTRAGHAARAMAGAADLCNHLVALADHVRSTRRATCVSVSKSDVKHRPLIGIALEQERATLYIERPNASPRRASRVVHQVNRHAHAATALIAVVPRARTGSDGRGLAAVHANLLAWPADLPRAPPGRCRPRLQRASRRCRYRRRPAVRCRYIGD